MYEENNFYGAPSNSPEIKTKSAVNFVSMSLVKVLLWMFLGVIITAGTAYLTSHSPVLFALTFNPAYLIISSILQIVICLAISKNALVKFNIVKATIWFLLYSALTGVTFGFIFLVVDTAALWGIFALSAGMFLIMIIAGLILKEQFLKLRTFILVGLISLLIMSVISWFFYSDVLFLGISVLGLGVFLILTAVDIARIKTMFETESNVNGVAIYGAFMLYLDFINIYLYILRIFLSSNRS